MDTNNLQRREFLKSGALAGAGLLILPSGSLLGAKAPSNKLNIALIGAHGRASAHYGAIEPENVAAICDVNEKNLALAAKKFPKAKRYFDWRKLLDAEKTLDAVVCATTDHTHAHVANWSMNRGLHVYCEKPMGISVEEARVVRETYMKNKNKLATQHGTQRHAIPNFNRVREMIVDGAIGDLSAVHVWGNRQLRRPGYLPLKGTPPETLHFDFWIGPSPMHDYNPDYFSGRPGANCLQWNMYWDFGTGQVGDMGSHTMDLAWNALDADRPTSAVAEGDKYNPGVTPVELKATFEIPANDWRPGIDVLWYQGGAMPPSPVKKLIDLNGISHGAMFKGSKGYVIADFSRRILVPFGKETGLDYWKRRTKDKLLPPLGKGGRWGFQNEWVDACKGDLKTTCNFDYAGKMVEMMNLGLVAYRAGNKVKIKYDGATGRVTNNDEADALCRRKYRDGWPLNG